MPADRIDTIVNLAKRRGFVYPSSEIYGGQRSAWDYGPLGVELKENVKRQWWRFMVQGRDDVVGRAKGQDFASAGEKGELFRIPLAHLREMHESWLPSWIEG